MVELSNMLEKMSVNVTSSPYLPLGRVDVFQGGDGNSFVQVEADKVGKFNINNGTLAVTSKDYADRPIVSVLPCTEVILDELEKLGFTKDSNMNVPYSNQEKCQNQYIQTKLDIAKAFNLLRKTIEKDNKQAATSIEEAKFAKQVMTR